MDVNFDITENFMFLLNDNSRIKILEGSSRCFDASQLVITKNGDKPIDDIDVGDEVLTFNESTKQNEYKRVKGLHQFKNDKKCLKITLKNGTVIKCTEDHEFYHEGAWVSAKHLVYLLHERNKRNLEENP